MKNNLALFLILICCFSCKQIKQEELVLSVLNEWIGKELLVPDSTCFFKYDENYNFCSDFDKADYRILNYIDSLDCLNCNLRLKEWNILIKELSEKGKTVIPVFVFSPKNTNRMKEIFPLVKRNALTFPIVIDSLDLFNKLNNFPLDNRFHTFLLNKDNQVLYIGNPVHNPKIEELYLKVIMGEKNVLTSNWKLKTNITLGRTSANLDVFDWKQEQSVDFVLTNIGDNLLLVEGVSTFCSCTTVEYSKEPTQSGKSLILKMKYKAEHPGHFNKMITVYCNVEGSPFQLKISGNAK